jgi:hypothetical protein
MVNARRLFALGSSGTWTLPEKLGCLTTDNFEKMRHGRSPTVTRGPYAGELAKVDHIVPIALEPQLGNEIANLEMMPRALNRRRGVKMGQRQRDYLRKFRAAGLLSAERARFLTPF